MRKVLLAIVLLGMLGWSVYEFGLAPNDTDREQAVVADGGENERDYAADVKKAFEEDRKELEEEETVVEKEVGLEVGNLAPDFELTTLSGEEVALSDYRGNKVMLNFWATWCPPCRAEMPDMQDFYETTEIEVLAVNLTETEPGPEQVQRFVDEYGITFPILLDEVIEVATIYEIQPVPTSYMIDSEGVIQFKTFGPLSYEQMLQASVDME